MVNFVKMFHGRGTGRNLRPFLIGDAKNEFRGFLYPETRQRPTYRYTKSEKNEFPVSRIDLDTSFRAKTRIETNTSF